MTPQDRIKTAFEAYQTGYSFAQENQWADALPAFKRAFALHGQQIRYSLFLGAALRETGDRDAAVELWSLAADHDAAIRIAQYQPNADALTRQCSKLADTEIRRYMSTLQADAAAACPDPGRINTALWPQTHFGAVDYPENGPRPYMFYVPEFPPVPVFTREDAEWTQILEAAFVAIRSEFLALSGQTAAPYVDAKGFMGPEWNALKGQDRWSSVHLFKDGEPTEDAARCPQTCAIMEQIPTVQHNGNPMEVFFSVLKPGTHIPPHFGLANSRLTVHLPLIIPDDCAIRVGDSVHEWTPGETFLFDDSYNHEAWNKSDQTRVVLIFEAWRPDMTPGEITAVEASFKARQDWLNARRVPDVSDVQT